MSYDRFEDDWNGIPASEVKKVLLLRTYLGETNTTSLLSLHLLLSLDLLLSLHLLLRRRAASFQSDIGSDQRQRKRQRSLVPLAVSGSLRRQNFLGLRFLLEMSSGIKQGLKETSS